MSTRSHRTIIADEMGARWAEVTAAAPEAVTFLRDALAHGSKLERDIELAAVRLGITDQQLREGRRKLNTASSYAGDGVLLHLQHAACIVCGHDTDHVEPEHPLPLCPSCPSPIRTWRWTRQRTDQKRGREHVKVAHRSDTWRTGINEIGIPAGSGLIAWMTTCSTVLDRRRDGRPNCGDPVVWKVAVTSGSRTLTSNYCDADLPPGDRPEPTLGETS